MTARMTNYDLFYKIVKEQPKAKEIAQELLGIIGRYYDELRRQYYKRNPYRVTINNKGKIGFSDNEDNGMVGTEDAARNSIANIINHAMNLLAENTKVSPSELETLKKYFIDEAEKQKGALVSRLQISQFKMFLDSIAQEKLLTPRQYIEDFLRPLKEKQQETEQDLKYYAIDQREEKQIRADAWSEFQSTKLQSTNEEEDSNPLRTYQLNFTAAERRKKLEENRERGLRTLQNTLSQINAEIKTLEEALAKTKPEPKDTAQSASQSEIAGSSAKPAGSVETKTLREESTAYGAGAAVSGVAGAKTSSSSAASAGAGFAAKPTVGAHETKLRRDEPVSVGAASGTPMMTGFGSHVAKPTRDPKEIAKNKEALLDELEDIRDQLTKYTIKVKDANEGDAEEAEIFGDRVVKGLTDYIADLSTRLKGNIEYLCFKGTKPKS